VCTVLFFSLMVRFYDFYLLFPSLDLDKVGLFCLLNVDLRVYSSCLFFIGKSGKVIFVFTTFHSSSFTLFFFFLTKNRFSFVENFVQATPAPPRPSATTLVVLANPSTSPPKQFPSQNPR